MSAQVAAASRNVAWRQRAACRGLGADTFFSPNVGSAIAVCRDCPVRQVCLEAALRTHPNDDFGVLGATTRRDRIRLRQGLPIVERVYSAPAVREPDPGTGDELTCRRGHPRTPDNTYTYKRGKGVARMCRECRRENMRRFHARRIAEREQQSA